MGSTICLKPEERSILRNDEHSAIYLHQSIHIMITLTVWVDTTVMYEKRYARVLIRSNSCFIQVSFLQLYTMLFIDMFLASNIIIMKSLILLYFICCGSTESMDNSTIVRDF